MHPTVDSDRNADQPSVRHLEILPEPIENVSEHKPPAGMLDLTQAAELLGIGRTMAYELVRTGQWPTPVIRIGRLIKIPSGPLMTLINTGRLPTTD